MTIETERADIRRRAAGGAARGRSIRELHGESDRRRLRVDARPGRSAAARLPRRRARLLRRRQRSTCRPGRRRSPTRPPGAFPTADEYSVSWPRGRLHLSHAAARGQRLRAAAALARPETPRSRSCSMRTCSQTRTGLRRDRRARAEPGRRAARLVGRQERSRDLRAAHPRSGDAGGSARGDRRTYPGVAWSAQSRLPLLPRPRRAAPALSGLAPPARHARPATTCSCSRSATSASISTLAGSRSGELAIITAASRDTTEVSADRSRAAARGAGAGRSRASGGSSTGSTTRAAAILSSSPTADAGVHADAGAARRRPAAASWTPVDCAAIAPARTDTRLLRCDVLADHLVLTVRRDGGTLLVDHRSRRRQRQARSRRAWPRARSALEHAEDYDRGSVIIAEESLIDPRDLVPSSTSPPATKRLLKRMEVPGYDPARYRTERLTAPARDGTRGAGHARPPRATPRSTAAPPACCTAMAPTRHASTRTFDRSLPSLLDRGVVYAIAHIRGGGECGRDWWQQGRLETKATTLHRLRRRGRLAGR